MALRLTPSNIFAFRVSGNLNNEKGEAEKFSFTLQANRRTEGEFAEIKNNPGDGLVADWMLDEITGWDGLLDEDGKPVEFSRSALQQLFQIPGMPLIVFRAYFENVGARAKN